jgi:hypothetical protein
VTDRIFASFLRRQRDEGMALAADSDVLTLWPAADDPPQHYVAEYRCRGLVRAPGGDVVEADRFHVGVWFPQDYLREADPFLVLRWLGPEHPFHPNIAARAPFLCAGVIRPGTFLVDLLWRVYEVIVWSRVTMRESDALNRDACAWARRHRDRFPLDDRPLRRALALVLEDA